MKERKRNENPQKDYYFPVIVCQIFLSAALLMTIIFMQKSIPGFKEDVSSHFFESDFLTSEFSDAVVAVKEIVFNDEVTYAVSGNKVVPYKNESENNEKEKETVSDGNLLASEQTTAAQQNENKVTDNKTVPISEIGITYKNGLESSEKDELMQQIIFPLEEGRYTSYFGERTDPINKGEDYHKGIDIGADEGDRIRAVYDGVVTSVGEDSRSGKYVFLSHPNGYVSFYCHCSEILVSENTVIRQGETIALVGSTGYSTGPHLHFELRVDGESIDPLPVLANAS